MYAKKKKKNRTSLIFANILPLIQDYACKAVAKVTLARCWLTYALLLLLYLNYENKTDNPESINFSTRVFYSNLLFPYPFL